MLSAKKELFTPSGGGYQISRSVRLRSSASAYFNRTPASASDRRTWTYSGWVKRGLLNTRMSLMGGYTGTTNGTLRTDITILDGAALNVGSDQMQTATDFVLQTTQLFRDPSAWYHIVVAMDTTQATSTNRVKIYVNGVQVTAFSTATYPSLNYQGGINFNNNQYINRWFDSAAGSFYGDGYLTEVNFIDGQALTPSSFGETNALTGVWQPKRYAGTYGTNGFYLNFSDNSGVTATTIGKDYSGNGNNWTPSAGISITAGATYDSMIDVPTLYADGGNGRGNYAVLNPLSTLYTVTAGNLDFTYTNSTSGVWYLKGTLAVSSDKYYWEVTPTNVGAGLNISIGIILSTNTQTNTTTINLVTDGYVYHSDGNKYSGAGGTTGVAYGATYTNNDVIGVALDLTAGTLVFYKNNVSQGTAFTGLTSSYMLLVCNHLGGTSRTVAGSVNAGQRPFTYTPPTGFVALNTQNLPTPTISNGANYMAATLYTGNGGSQSIANTVNGISFQPDWVWIKGRSGATDHALTDAVRGVTKELKSNTTGAETTAVNGLTAFNSGGFSIGTAADYNTNAATYVGWQWKEGATQGFDIVTYTGNQTAGKAVPHSLGVAPAMIIVKARGQATSWPVYHQSLGATKWLLLNSTQAVTTTAQEWDNQPPSSTNFYVGNSSSNSNQSTNYVAYLFAEVAGFSRFGSYTGNGSTDGPFVFLGFRPRFIMFKRTDSTGSWFMEDSSRGTYNVMGPELYAESSAAEATATRLDFLSNGFKMRAANAGDNANGGTYVYMAFCENPFKLSLAR